MSTKGFLGIKKRVAQEQPLDRRRKTKKRFKPPKPPAPPKATFVSGERYENNDPFSHETNEVQSMLDFLKKNDSGNLK